MLTQAWQETLPRETLSFDVLQLPRQPAQLLTIDEVRIHFRVWDGGQWRTLRTATHLMQRDLYALHPAHEGKTLIYTDGGGWIYTEKEIISDEPTRTVPIGPWSIKRALRAPSASTIRSKPRTTMCWRSPC